MVHYYHRMKQAMGRVQEKESMEGALERPNGHSIDRELTLDERLEAVVPCAIHRQCTFSRASLQHVEELKTFCRLGCESSSDTFEAAGDFRKKEKTAK
jgi:hypothetical protein